MKRGFILVFIPVTKLLLTVNTGWGSAIKHALHNVCRRWYREVEPPPSVKHLSEQWSTHSHIYTVVGVIGKDVICVNNYFSVCFSISLKLEDKVLGNNHRKQTARKEIRSQNYFHYWWICWLCFELIESPGWCLQIVCFVQPKPKYIKFTLILIAPNPHIWEAGTKPVWHFC